MSMDQRDEQFESFLREFQPRYPRALPAVIPSQSIWMPRLAAAAVVLIVIGLSFWSLSRKPSVSSAMSTEGSNLSPAALMRLALEDPARLDAVLDSSARSELPRFDSKDSALRVLAKE
jgi:hypothetical protein